MHWSKGSESWALGGSGTTLLADQESKISRSKLLIPSRRNFLVIAIQLDGKPIKLLALGTQIVISYCLLESMPKLGIHSRSVSTNCIIQVPTLSIFSVYWSIYRKVYHNTPYKSEEGEGKIWQMHSPTFLATDGTKSMWAELQSQCFAKVWYAVKGKGQSHQYLQAICLPASETLCIAEDAGLVLSWIF